jgi:methylphosphotriester-DNA--protein-cysteine methyltransferase
MKLFTLTGPDGTPFLSSARGTLGGHRRNKIYGRLDCKTAARYLARGSYQKNRVFFADEASARLAGFRPCSHCLPGRAKALVSGAAEPIQS